MSFTNDIEKSIERLKKFRSQMPKVSGAVIIKQINTLSDEGRDSDGKAFARYTKRYASEKRKRYGSDTPVNLKATGKMRASLRQEINDDGTFLITTSEAERPKAEGNQKKRKFMGIHNDTPKNIHKALTDLWNAS